MPIPRIAPCAVRFLFIGVLGLLSVSLVACDSGGSNDDDDEEQEKGFPEPPGRPGFTSSITGRASEFASGTALHGANLAGDLETASQAIAIRLTDEATARIELIATHTAALEPGVHAIGAPTDGADFAAWVTLAGRATSLRATAGSLEIMRREHDTLVGRFRFAADDAALGPFTVTGAFRSVVARQDGF